MINHIRSTDIISQKLLGIPITVIGTGGTGSTILFELAKMGCRNLTAYDPDFVEPHNPPGSIYGKCHIGMKKVEALKNIVHDFTGTKIKVYPELFQENRNISGIVISAIDSMKARKEIWDKSIKLNPMVQLFVDVRIGGTVIKLYFIRPCDPYETQFFDDKKELYGDENVADLPCTRQGVIDISFFTAAFVGWRVRDFLCGKKIPQAIDFDTVTDGYIRRFRGITNHNIVSVGGGL